MIMVAEALPNFKSFLREIPLSDTARLLAIRVIAAFVLHAGRMSCLQAAGAVRCEARHRAQISRFLARPRCSSDFLGPVDLPNSWVPARFARRCCQATFPVV
jgi:hypothetical protein